MNLSRCETGIATSNCFMGYRIVKVSDYSSPIPKIYKIVLLFVFM